MVLLITGMSFKLDKIFYVYIKEESKETRSGTQFLLLGLNNSTYLDVELQVLVHGIDVVKDVVCDPWDDAHELRVV